MVTVDSNQALTDQRPDIGPELFESALIEPTPPRRTENKQPGEMPFWTQVEPKPQKRGVIAMLLAKVLVYRQMLVTTPDRSFKTRTHDVLLSRRTGYTFGRAVGRLHGSGPRFSFETGVFYLAAE